MRPSGMLLMNAGVPSPCRHVAFRLRIADRSIAKRSCALVVTRRANNKETGGEAPPPTPIPNPANTWIRAVDADQWAGVQIGANFLADPRNCGLITTQQSRARVQTKSNKPTDVEQWKAARFENGSSNKAAASITANISSGIGARLWSRCIEKDERRKFHSVVRARSSISAWCAGLAKSLDSIRPNCRDRRAASDRECGRGRPHDSCF